MQIQKINGLGTQTRGLARGRRLKLNTFQFKILLLGIFSSIFLGFCASLVLDFHSDVQTFQFKVLDDVISVKKTKRQTIKDMSNRQTIKDMSNRHVYLMSKIFILDKSVLLSKQKL